MHRRILPRLRIIGKNRLNAITIHWYFKNGFEDLTWVDLKSLSPCKHLISPKGTLNKSDWAALLGQFRTLSQFLSQIKIKLTVTSILDRRQLIFS